MAKSTSGNDDNYYSSSSVSKSFAGCTATVAVITPAEIYCCNAGDSRTVLSKGKQAIDLSKDHKPDDVDERRNTEERWNDEVVRVTNTSVLDDIY